LPPGPLSAQVTFFSKLQAAWAPLTSSQLKQINSTLSDTPLPQERAKLLSFCPQLPTEIIPLMINLLKLPLEEVLSLQRWLADESLNNDTNREILLRVVTGIDSMTLLAVKRRIALPSLAEDLAASSAFVTSVATAPHAVMTTSGSTSSTLLRTT